MGCYYIACMNQWVQSACGLCQVAIIGIIGPDSVQNEIQTIREVGDASPQTVKIKSVLNVGSLYFAKHFVSFQATKPVAEQTIRKMRRRPFNLHKVYSEEAYHWIQGSSWPDTEESSLNAMVLCDIDRYYLVVVDVYCSHSSSEMKIMVRRTR